MKLESVLVSGSTIEAGTESPVLIHLPGTSAIERTLISRVAGESSSSVGSDIVAAALSDATLMASSVSHGGSTEGGPASSNSSKVSSCLSSGSAIL
jgi:hypothetical protein